MKRVLLTVHKFFPDHRAGTEVLTLKVAQELKRRQWEVLIVTANPPDLDARHSRGPETTDFVYEGVNVHVVEESLRLKGYTFHHEYFHPAIEGHFKQLLAGFAPSLVHIFHAQNLSAGIIDASEAACIPVVASLTDFWFVCPVVQLKRPDGSLCRGPKALASNCLTCYTPELFPPAHEVAEALAKKLPPIGRAIASLPAIARGPARFILKGAYSALKLPAAVSATVRRPERLRDAANRMQAIMVPTILMQDIFVENGIRKDLLHHVPFGLDTSQLTDHQSKTPSDLVRVGFIGTIFEHKGVDLLIQAFQLLPAETRARLLIYGDLNQFPDYGARVKQLAERDLPNSKRIEFPGTFPNSKLGEILDNLDVLVVPSRWYENTPLVIQSALATRTPLIVTNLGGMSELVKNGVNGLTFKLNDPASLRDQLKRVIEEPGLLETFRANIGPERTVQEMVDDIEAVYEKVLSRKKNTGGSPPDPVPSGIIAS